MTEEIWRSVPNLLNIEISSLGNARRASKPIKIFLFNGIYPSISIKPSEKLGPPWAASDARYIKIHELVLTSFDKPRPPGNIPLFLDGNQSNCHLDNLRWASITEARTANRTELNFEQLRGILSGSSKVAGLTMVDITRLKQSIIHALASRGFKLT